MIRVAGATVGSSRGVVMVSLAVVARSASASRFFRHGR
jgi:hypothetical protein